jgi:Dual specificity phosphatase, catalytic domain
VIEVFPQLFVGNAEDCRTFEGTILHACKTCHQRYLGYVEKLDAYDPQYLVARGDTPVKDLYLNLVDAPFEPSVALVESALGFLLEHHFENAERVLVHCDQGISRSPSLALLYLVHRFGMVDKTIEMFKIHYPSWAPRKGMIKMLERYGIEL